MVAGVNFHCLTALIAALSFMGMDLVIFTQATFPCSSIQTSRRIVPWVSFSAGFGHDGSTRVFTAAWVTGVQTLVVCSGVHSRWEAADWATNMRTTADAKVLIMMGFDTERDASASPQWWRSTPCSDVRDSHSA